MVLKRLALSAATLALVALPTSAHAVDFETAVKHTTAPAAVKHTAVKHTNLPAAVKHTAVKHTSIQAAVKHTLSPAAAPADLALLGELGLLG